MRRLPVYLLLDCSESMIGEGILSVQRGVETLLSTLRSDPHALESVWLSCITFDREAQLAFPLTELTEVQSPKLLVRPGTALGAALNLCADRIQKEVMCTTVSQKGDWRPLVIVITDGQPTDDWKPALARLGKNAKPRPANIYAIGCGDDVDMGGLSELTEIVLHMPDMSEEKFKKLFVWLTASVSEGSHGVHEPNDGLGIDLSKLPADAVIQVEHSTYFQKPGRQRQVFLYARCVKKKNPYLMRFRWSDNDDEYHGVASHVLEMDERETKGSVFAMPEVSSNDLVWIPACPYCKSQGAARCGGCGGIMCADPQSVATDCPHCGLHLDSFGPGGFNISQSAG